MSRRWSARVAPDLADRPAGEQARELARRLRDAQADAQKCTTLTQQRQREEGSLRAAETQREEARVCLERLCKEAGCTDFDDLPEAERRSQNRARLEADRTACEEQLMVAAAGADLAAFAAEVEQADPDALDASIEELERTSQPKKKSCAASTRPSAPSGGNWPAWTAATAPPRPPKKRRRSWPGFKETSRGMRPSNWRRR